MNKLILTFILFLLFVLINNLKSQENLFTGELIIHNNSVNRDIVLRVYPVSCIFNGKDLSSNMNYFRYDLRAINPNLPGGTHQPPYYTFINERNQTTDSFTISSNSFLEVNHDQDGNLNNKDACVGYGKYKVKISWYEDNYYKLDTCTVEWDAGYPYTDPNHLTLWSSDLNIYFYDNNNNPRLNFEWSSSTREYPITCVNKEITAWDQQYGTFGQSDSIRRIRNKDFGNFLYDTVNNNPYSNFPQDSRRNCGIENHVFNDNRSGILTLNLVIDKNISTRDTLIDTITNIYISEKVLIKLNSGKIFNMNTPLIPSGGYTHLIIGSDSAKLLLRPDEKINVEYPNKITLDSGGFLIMNQNSEVNIFPGAYFCNEGGKILGNGKVIFRNGLHQNLCSQLVDYLLKDSVKFILDSNSVVSVPANTNLHIRGNTTSLILNPGSKLLFGENSSIICDQGGKVIANNATFGSIDSTKKWNGISLSDLSQDTIKNCTIKNAMYGITINDKFDENDDSYSTEISNCNFINQTGYVLNNAVYIAGSNNVLIMNNTLSSTSLQKGFTHGLYAEYCPEGAFNIIGNNISGAGNGMTLIGCSPFAAQNTITGNEYSECGLFLDNSNGTFEYNVISDFYCSFFTYYSSPDLLKNIFDNYYGDNIWLSSSSVPVMHPLINGSSVFWYAGDNLITGSPSNSGILFEEDANPLMNYGYNRFEMTNNDYYIQGINPSGGGREFFVIQNYWGGTPDSNKFDVANADVIYIPYDNNSSQARETNSDNKFDIGFGLYDTVYYYEADNPNSAQDLYIEAYQKESAAADSGDFSQAIYIYKEIFKDYKDSSYASSCQSRIYGCFEKKQSAQSEYSSLENYCTNISNDTSYNEIQRNISEEFMIKSKVKQNRAEEAVSEYTEIYNQNTGTPKGMHAFINKEILSAGMGDNPNVNSQFDNIQMKLNALSQVFDKIITKEKNIFSKMEIKSEGYSLSQNYPNPFNPVTKISFTVSTGGYVTLKVYDITGREVKRLAEGYMQSGRYEVELNGNDLSSGVYYFTMHVGNFRETKRMLLIK